MSHYSFHFCMEGRTTVESFLKAFDLEAEEAHCDSVALTMALFQRLSQHA